MPTGREIDLVGVKGFDFDVGMVTGRYGEALCVDRG